MRFDLQKFVRGAVAVAMVTVFAVPASLMAQATDHIVGSSDLRSATLAATQTRQTNLAKVQKFVSSEIAAKALKSAHMDAEQVKTAAASLSDAELAQLAVRADKAQADFAAGSLSDRDLIIILVAVAALILIIVAVR